GDYKATAPKSCTSDISYIKTVKSKTKRSNSYKDQSSLEDANEVNTNNTVPVLNLKNEKQYAVEETLSRGKNYTNPVITIRITLTKTTYDIQLDDTDNIAVSVIHHGSSNP
ncbi:unnamed protein product, partial [Owenia fusiformis]